jgi:hypothetical protein
VGAERGGQLRWWRRGWQQRYDRNHERERDYERKRLHEWSRLGDDGRQLERNDDRDDDEQQREIHHHEWIARQH